MRVLGCFTKPSVPQYYNLTDYSIFSVTDNRQPQDVVSQTLWKSASAEKLTSHGEILSLLQEVTTCAGSILTSHDVSVARSAQFYGAADGASWTNINRFPDSHIDQADIRRCIRAQLIELAFDIVSLGFVFMF